MREERPIRGIAFDLDGTLTDSAPGLTAALDRTLPEQGLPQACLARIAKWIGNGADVLVERALRWATHGEPDAALQRAIRLRFDEYYAGTVASGSSLFPEVADTLAQLALQGLPMAVVTNKSTPFVAPLLALLGIERHFALIIGGDDVSAKKPHPAPLYLVLGLLGLYDRELLFVGDSCNNILAAKAAICPSAGMTYGYHYGAAITLSHQDYVLDRFTDLLPVLGLPPFVNQNRLK